MNELLPPLSWKESMSPSSDYSPQENPVLGAPQRLPFGKEPSIPPKPNLSQDKRMLGALSVTSHRGEEEIPWGRREEGESDKTPGRGARWEAVVIETVRSTSSCRLCTGLKVFFHPLSHPSLDTRENQAGRSEPRERWLSLERRLIQLESPQSAGGGGAPKLQAGRRKK